MTLRILIAEDSQLFATVLEDMIEAEPDMEVCGIASDGRQAVQMCVELEPDLVVMDIQMPRMDGLSATEKIMGSRPTPVLVVTSDPYRGGVNLSFKALSAGALDLVAKPDEMPMPEAERLELLQKIRILAEIPVVRHVRGNLKAAGDASSSPSVAPDELPFDESPPKTGLVDEATPIVGIVGSTGGPSALARLLEELPANFPPVLVVQHITRGFSQHLARWLDDHSEMRVVEAEHGQPIKPGHVYIAPTEKQLEMSSGRFLNIYDGPVVAGHRPSGDVMLRSLARHASPRAMGVVLSGMGCDGTVGMAALFRSGAMTLVQDEPSSVVYSMPRSALERGVVDEVVELDRMAGRLRRLVAQLADGENP